MTLPRLLRRPTKQADGSETKPWLREEYRHDRQKVHDAMNHPANPQSRFPAINLTVGAPSTRPLPSARLRSGVPGFLHRAAVAVWRGIFFCTMRVRTRGTELLPAGGCVLAVCHLSHLDPVVVSCLLPRRISWLARIEFYQHWIMASVMRGVGAIAINRRGYPRAPLREAVMRLRAGEVVGIFPEGEIMQGLESVLCGGTLRHGAVWVAARSGCPIVPVVVLGTERLREVGPWLPAKRGRLWLLVGTPMTVPPGAYSRNKRATIAAELETRFVRLFEETRIAFALPETMPPSPSRPHADPSIDPLTRPCSENGILTSSDKSNASP
jgi:1-acyl-sn-glycerol-3-phosphate acyltransferase